MTMGSLPLGCYPNAVPVGSKFGPLIGSNALVDQARTYLGVPWRHRGRSRRGVDCAGLPWCCYADLGVLLPDLERYGREPHRDGLMRAVRAALGDPVTGMRPGDVVVMTSGAMGATEPHHMGILGDGRYGLSLIHSDGTQGVSRVIEHDLNDYFRRRIVAVFRRDA